jgi:Cu/Ag efflux pump CusA
LAPILVTAAAGGLGLVPLVIIGGIPGQEIMLPTAIVILVGLVTSTLLTLFVVPFVLRLARCARSRNRDEKHWTVEAGGDTASAAGRVLRVV